MVKHIVMFRLNGTPEERLRVCGEFRNALLSLPEKIDCLKGMEVGINANPKEEWDLVLTAAVPAMEDVETYSLHPAHQAAAAIVAPHKAARACVDYEIPD